MMIFRKDTVLRRGITFGHTFESVSAKLTKIGAQPIKNHFHQIKGDTAKRCSVINMYHYNEGILLFPPLATAFD